MNIERVNSEAILSTIKVYTCNYHFCEIQHKSNMTLTIKFSETYSDNGFARSDFENPKKIEATRRISPNAKFFGTFLRFFCSFSGSQVSVNGHFPFSYAATDFAAESFRRRARVTSFLFYVNDLYTFLWCFGF